MPIPMLLALLSIFFGAASIYIKLKQPATIWLGLTFFGFTVTFVSLLLTLFIESDYLFLLGTLLAWSGIVFFVLALLIVGLFIFNGLKLIWLEGFEFNNTLSFLTGIFSLFYLIFWPILFDLTKRGWLNILYQLVSAVIVYFAFVFFLYTLTNLLNLVHLNRKPVDYFIVLGAALDGDEVPPILAGRIDKAIEQQAKQTSGKIIFTGGQGPDELVPEGEAMAKYAFEQGVDAAVILQETESTSTEENIRLSKKIIAADWEKDRLPVLGLITNNYHLLRALMTAKNLGLNCLGFGSFSKFYYSLNAFLREYIAYLQMTYKVHLFMVIILGIGQAIFR